MTEENNVTESNTITIRDNSKRATLLMKSFWIYISILLIGIVSDYYELELIRDVQQGYFITDDEAGMNDLRQSIIGFTQFGSFIALAVIFVNWFRRAYGNLHRVGAKYLKHTEVAAAWSWFIPIISLFRPVGIMNEIARETQHFIRKHNRSYTSRNLSLLIGVWWMAFLISNYVGNYAARTVFKLDTLEQMEASARAMMYSDSFDAVAALLAVWVVTSVSKLETQLAEEVVRSGGRIEGKMDLKRKLA